MVFATLGLVLLSAGQLILNRILQLAIICALFRPSFALIDHLVNLFNDILILSREMRVHLLATSLKALYAAASGQWRSWRLLKAGTKLISIEVIIICS